MTICCSVSNSSSFEFFIPSGFRRKSNLIIIISSAASVLLILSLTFAILLFKQKMKIWTTIIHNFISCCARVNKRTEPTITQPEEDIDCQNKKTSSNSDNNVTELRDSNQESVLRIEEVVSESENNERAIVQTNNEIQVA